MRFNFKSAIWAGIVATFVMVVVLGLFGVNAMKVVGMAAGQTGNSVYVLGAIVHLIVGVIYALIYALIFEPLFKKMPKYLSGAIFGLLPFIVGMTMGMHFMDFLRNTFHVASTINDIAPPCHMNPNDPCNPCNPAYPGSQCNPCNGCNPCYPCNPQPMNTSYHPMMAAAQPCNPHGGTMYDSCEACEPCNPDPMSASHNMKWLICLVSNLVYGIVLGLVYRPSRR